MSSCFFPQYFYWPLSWTPGPDPPGYRSWSRVQTESVFEQRPGPPAAALRASTNSGTVQATWQRSTEGPVISWLQEVSFCRGSLGKIWGNTNDPSAPPLPFLPHRTQTETGNFIIVQHLDIWPTFKVWLHFALNSKLFTVRCWTCISSRHMASLYCSSIHSVYR